jgi:hypothetical protein
VTCHLIFNKNIKTDAVEQDLRSLPENMGSDTTRSVCGFRVTQASVFVYMFCGSLLVFLLDHSIVRRTNELPHSR